MVEVIGCIAGGKRVLPGAWIFSIHHSPFTIHQRPAA
jgi:hypothetical protein